MLPYTSTKGFKNNYLPLSMALHGYLKDCSAGIVFSYANLGDPYLRHKSQKFKVNVSQKQPFLLVISKK